MFFSFSRKKNRKQDSVLRNFSIFYTSAGGTAAYYPNNSCNWITFYFTRRRAIEEKYIYIYVYTAAHAVVNLSRFTLYLLGGERCVALMHTAEYRERERDCRLYVFPHKHPYISRFAAVTVCSTALSSLLSPFHPSPTLSE